jgi:hypothetical protein
MPAGPDDRRYDPDEHPVSGQGTSGIAFACADHFVPMKPSYKVAAAVTVCHRGYGGAQDTRSVFLALQRLAESAHDEAFAEARPTLGELRRHQGRRNGPFEAQPREINDRHSCIGDTRAERGRDDALAGGEFLHDAIVPTPLNPSHRAMRSS